MHKSNTIKLIHPLLILMLIIQSGCLPAQEDMQILPGAYQTKEYFPILTDRRVGVVVNHASLLNATNLVDTLLGQGISLSKIYSPEHGFKGRADAGAAVLDDTYSVQEIPVISLYGSRRKPSQEDLEGVDVMLFDLQDVGVRFYTYISTLHYVMEACAEAGIPLVLLDRPNPNGHYIDGPVMQQDHKSFVGMHRVPAVYGMTIGEYAQMLNGEYWLADSMHCELSIICCKNYDHNSFYNLPSWPSPNLQSMRAIYLYPSTGFFEGTVVSEGRGTEAPFQLIGHPAYSDKTIEFTPESIAGASLNPKLKDQLCFGINLQEIPLDSIRTQRKINLSYLLHFYEDMRQEETFFIDYFDLLAGNVELREQITQGLNAEQIRSSWQKDLGEFKKVRAKYLLYPDF